FFPELRFILPSGRKRVEDLGRLWPHVSDECVVLTSYSSTETTQMCCSIIDKSTHLTSEILDVGRPLPGKEILILDADGNSLAAGIEGEIVVHSRFISREYWRRPELSSEKFLVLDDGVTVQYRSGDFGTLQADGQLAITGRKDSQIKLRGYRVVLDEVENALARLPEIKEAAVLADFHRDRLNAYLVSGNPAPTQAAIRAQLAQTIPDYSLPATYTFLQAFPTLPSGKIDKHNLPQPDETRPRISADYVPPVKPDEKLLVAIWESVLGIKGIGLDDNFFELGGHSLLATEVVFKLVEELGIELPVYQLFAHSTVRQLAEIVRTKQVQIEQKIEAIERNQPLPLSYGEERLWFIHQLETDSAQYTTSRGFRIRGDVDADVLAESLELLSQRQEALRTTFKVMDGKPYRLISAEKQYSFQLTDVRSHDVQTREAKVREHMKQVGRTRFDLENGPLFRFQLIQLKDEEFVFIFSAHHIVTDAWSSSLFWQELGPIYAAVLEGIDSELPEMSIQYADFASWQRERQNSILDRQLAYWKAQFENVPPLLELPLDFPRSNRQHTHGRSVYKPIPAELIKKLSKLSNELQATTFMTYFAVLNLLLYRYSGQETIVVGTPIAGRTSSQTQNILGFFPNTLAIPTKINGAQAFEAFFAGCKQQLIDAFENQELPFEKLVNELAVDRSLNHHPLFQAMFMMLDITPDKFPFYDFDVTVEPKERENIIFDLRVVVEQDGDLETIRWDYNDEIFREQTISQLGDHFIVLLEQV
ncbi:MAG: condensation domain-containing protein, partial [Chloroflexota bacterium]